MILDLSMQVLKLLLLQYIIAFLPEEHINEGFPTSLPFRGKMPSIGGKPHTTELVGVKAVCFLKFL